MYREIQFHRSFPQSLPAYLFFGKIPIIKVGKKEEAASPKAKATVLATKLDGGLIPKYAAMARAPKEAMRA